MLGCVCNKIKNCQGVRGDPSIIPKQHCDCGFLREWRSATCKSQNGTYMCEGMNYWEEVFFSLLGEAEKKKAFQINACLLAELWKKKFCTT